MTPQRPHNPQKPCVFAVLAATGYQVCVLKLTTEPEYFQIHIVHSHSHSHSSISAYQFYQPPFESWLMEVLPAEPVQTGDTPPIL